MDPKAMRPAQRAGRGGGIRGRVDGEPGRPDDPGPDAVNPVAGKALSQEEAEFLLEAFQEFVDEVEPGAGLEDEAIRDEIERLISSLHALPIPASLKGEAIEEISSWASILVTEGGHEEEGGPEEIRNLIHEQLAELRKLLA